MAKNIGATLSLKDGNFFTGIKSAAAATAGLKDELSDTRKKISDFGSGLKDLAVKAAGVMATVGTAAMGVAGAALNIGTEYKTALNGISAQTGVSKEKLESLNGVLKDIYSENYGESFQDIADAISTVTNNADNIDTSSIKQFTTDAIALRDTFGYDIQESVNSANMLIKQFGMSGTEAFNLIAQGTQLGLNKNGDFLDTINEYSVHFKQIGISAEGMFNAIANGTANGAFSVDKLGDAVKEFGIRVKDGTGDEAFQALGLSAEEMKKAFVSGGAAGEQAFKSVTNALFSMDDKVQQNLLGVQLFGTMWEDLGVEGVKALSDLDGEFNRVHDTMSEIKNIKYDDLGSAFEGLKRLLTVKLLLPISEELTPAVSDFINNLRASFEDGALSGAVTALSTGIVSGLRGIGGVAKNVFSAFSTAIENNRPAIDNLKTAFGNVKDAISNAFSGDSSGFITKLADTIVPLACNALSTLMNTASGVANFFVNNFDSIKPILKGVLSGFLAYKSMSGINNVFNTVKGSINGLKGAFKAAKSATGIIKSVKTFGTALSGIKGIIGGVGSAITFLTSPVGLIVVAIGAAIAIGVALYKNWDTIKAKAQDLYNAIATKFPAIGKVFGAVKDTVSEKLSNIKQAYEEHGGGLKGIAFGAL
ncbi:MAG: phage tail tape measure protein, partial [Clostridia bacterium]